MSDVDPDRMRQCPARIGHDRCAAYAGHPEDVGHSTCRPPAHLAISPGLSDERIDELAGAPPLADPLHWSVRRDLRAMAIEIQMWRRGE